MSSSYGIFTLHVPVSVMRYNHVVRAIERLVPMLSNAIQGHRIKSRLSVHQGS